ncbi:NH(3)-dependent NAD(+) synthetase [Castellaniella denitrificans]
MLGISGGVDSLTAGCLSQRAVERVRAQGGDARFVAMRLPYGTQLDEADAQASLTVIRPDELLTVDVRPAADAMLDAVRASGQAFRDAAQQDFLHGNIKARQRMIAQYAVAGARGGLVVGTDHAAEALMGFFTKFGDGAADVTPLAGLSKRRVRALAAAMGAHRDLVFEVPTADLELLKPLKPDEDAFGVSYEQIDDFLEGRDVAPGSLRHHRVHLAAQRPQARPADRALRFLRAVRPARPSVWPRSRRTAGVPRGRACCR